MMGQLINFLRIVWIVLKKAVRVWLRQPPNLAVIFIPALGFLLVSALGSALVGGIPLSLVTLGQASTGIEIQHMFLNVDNIRITRATTNQAGHPYHDHQ